MNNLSKTDIRSLRGTMMEDACVKTRLERADLGGAGKGRTLPNEIGRRLRSVFPAPEMTQEDKFDSLLKQISTLLP